MTVAQQTYSQMYIPMIVLCGSDPNGYPFCHISDLPATASETDALRVIKETLQQSFMKWCAKFPHYVDPAIQTKTAQKLAALDDSNIHTLTQQVQQLAILVSPCGELNVRLVIHKIKGESNELMSSMKPVKTVSGYPFVS